MARYIKGHQEKIETVPAAAVVTGQIVPSVDVVAFYDRPYAAGELAGASYTGVYELPATALAGADLASGKAVDIADGGDNLGVIALTSTGRGGVLAADYTDGDAVALVSINVTSKTP